MKSHYNIRENMSILYLSEKGKEYECIISILDEGVETKDGDVKDIGVMLLDIRRRMFK